MVQLYFDTHFISNQIIIPKDIYSFMCEEFTFISIFLKKQKHLKLQNSQFLL